MNRVSTIRMANEIWFDACASTNEGKTADWATRTIWMAAGIVGGIGFFASFGALLLPMLAGWSWLHATLTFAMTQWVSQILLDLRVYWVKASAFFWLAYKGLRGGIAKAFAEPQNVDALEFA